MATTLLDENGHPKYRNRLVDESSPYLKQHAFNPVNWYPWGEEAFSVARAEDKPVFLSIGYSTCHWCHVMEHESFANEHIASILNEHFISIKLDREQRPDLDEIYMTGVQLLTGRGGWPMSNFITAEAKPFFAGTYYPPESFTKLLIQIADVWQHRRSELLAQADQIAESIHRHTSAHSETVELMDNLSAVATEELLGRHDEIEGGFGGAPKFPNESQILVVLEEFRRHGNQTALQAIRLTLDKMSQGGIYDHVGGGFHRYATDVKWLVPHFEKMLYNQAQMVVVYGRAYSNTRDPAYRRIVEETIDYVLRDMTDESGMFFSATDADSESVEGKFFVWDQAELALILEPAQFDLVIRLYGVSKQGNFEGSNILNLKSNLEDFAKTNSIPAGSLVEALAAIRERLYLAREERIHPLRDEKIITSWNAMMINSLTRSGWILDRSDYLDAARRAAESLWLNAYSDSDKLWRIQFEGQVSIPAILEDYAYLAESMLILYLYGGDEKWLERGQRLIDDMVSLFWDSEHGGFFLSQDRSSGPMITRPKSPSDGAMPSGNSVAIAALVLLLEATGDKKIEDLITGSLQSFSGLIKASPSAFPYMIMAATDFLSKSDSAVQFCAQGKVRVLVRYQDDTTTVRLVISDSWHINSNQPLSTGLSPTRVLGDHVVQYPAGQIFEPGFQQEKMDVYQGSVDILVRGNPSVIEIQLQACNDAICLSPETVVVKF